MSLYIANAATPEAWEGVKPTDAWWNKKDKNKLKADSCQERDRICYDHKTGDVSFKEAGERPTNQTEEKLEGEYIWDRTKRNETKRKNTAKKKENLMKKAAVEAAALDNSLLRVVEPDGIDAFCADKHFQDTVLSYNEFYKKETIGDLLKHTADVCLRYESEERYTDRSRLLKGSRSTLDMLADRLDLKEQDLAVSDKKLSDMTLLSALISLPPDQVIVDVSGNARPTADKPEPEPEPEPKPEPEPEPEQTESCSRRPLPAIPILHVPYLVFGGKKPTDKAVKAFQTQALTSVKFLLALIELIWHRAGYDGDNKKQVGAAARKKHIIETVPKYIDAMMST